MIPTVDQLELLKSFGLTAAQKAEVWSAWCAAPEQTELCARRAQQAGRREHSNGTGLLLAALRRGDHLEPYLPVPSRRITGWRWQRGSHSGTYLQDPAGTDPLPKGYV